MVDFSPSVDALNLDADAVLKELKRRKRCVIMGDRFGFENYRQNIGVKTGIYGVFCNDELIYIGKTKNAAKRLQDHFVKCSSGTRSKLAAFSELLAEGKKVEVSFVEVPASIYSAIEEILIAKLDPRMNQRAS